MTAPPAHLSESASGVWLQVVGSRPLAGADWSAAEAYCVQVARMRDAQSRVDSEGLVVADEKGRPMRHPALEIELAAAAEMRAWVSRRPDLLGPQIVTGEGTALDELARRRAAGNGVAARQVRSPRGN